MRVRKFKKKTHIKSTPERLRLSVFRSNKHFFAQIIDDIKNETLVSASSLKLEGKTGLESARDVGKLLAENAKKKDIVKLVFDRGRYRYIGRVKEFAQSARENGLVF